MSRGIGVLLVVLAVLAAKDAAAQRVSPQTIHFAIPEPLGLGWDHSMGEVLAAWAGSVARDSHGSLTIRFTRPSDENAIVAALRRRAVDGAELTEVGLAQLAPALVTTSAPGVCPDYASWDRARVQLASRQRASLDAVGLRLVAWSEHGLRRTFARRRIVQPSDLAGATVWYPRPDPILAEYLRSVGANESSASFDDIGRDLANGTLDAVIGPAGAVRNDWLPHLHDVTDAPSAVVTGAFVVDRVTFAGLPYASQSLLERTGAQAEELMRRRSRERDDAHMDDLVRVHGWAHVGAGLPAWQATAASVRARLTGPLFSARELALAVAASAP